VTGTIIAVAKAVDSWDDAGPQLLSSSTWLRLAVGSGPLLAGYGMAAIAWIALLRCLGVRSSAVASAGVYLTAQFAKYLPGNVGHYVGRVVLAARHGQPTAVVVLGITLEFALLLAIAALLGLPMLASVALRFAAPLHDLPTTGVLVLGAGVACAAAAAVVLAARHDSLRAGIRARAAGLRAAMLRPAGLAWLALSTLLSVLAFALTSLSLLALDDGLTDLSAGEFLRMASLFGVAWIAGVLTPGAPAGLGVRELILVQGLTATLGGAHAVSTALLFRLLTTLADATALAAGLGLLRMAPRGGPEVTRHGRN
jgi:uncharacterized membrane protein YbhN (UPF0104 family)